MSDLETVKNIQICFAESFGSLSPIRQSAAKVAVAALLETPVEKFTLRSVCEGNVGFDVTLSARRAEQLHKMLQENNGQLRLLGVQSVVLERPSNEIELWAVEDRRFTLVKVLPGLQLDENGELISPFEPVPRIWIFHLAYFVVMATLALSILRFSTQVSISILFISLVSALGVLLARTQRLVAAHVLAVAIGLGAPIVLCARLWPNQTVILFLFLVSSIFITRRTLF